MSDLASARPGPDEPPAPRPGGPSDVSGLFPRASELFVPAARDPLAPAPRDPHGSAPRDPHGSAVREPHGPAVRDPHGSASRDPHGTSVRDAHGSAVRDPHGPAVRDPFVPAARDPADDGFALNPMAEVTADRSDLGPLGPRRSSSSPSPSAATPDDAASSPSAPPSPNAPSSSPSASGSVANSVSADGALPGFPGDAGGSDFAFRDGFTFGDATGIAFGDGPGCAHGDGSGPGFAHGDGPGSGFAHGDGSGSGFAYGDGAGFAFGDARAAGFAFGEADAFGESGWPAFAAESGFPGFPDGLSAAAVDETEPTARTIAALLEMPQTSPAELADAVAWCYDDAALPLLLPLARHADAGVRRSVAQALPSVLGDADPADTVRALIALSADGDDDVRDWACFALGTQLSEVDNPVIRDALAARLDDPHDDTRCEALLGLARRRDSRVLPVLHERLSRDNVYSLEIDAAGALGHASLHTLVRGHLSGWDDDVVARVCAALRLTDPDGVGDDLLDGLADWFRQGAPHATDEDRYWWSVTLQLLEHAEYRAPEIAEQVHYRLLNAEPSTTLMLGSRLSQLAGDHGWPRWRPSC